MNVVVEILKEAIFLLNRMSVYLLFGFLVGGILHVFLRTGTIARHLGDGNLLSVLKATLLGIPLPLCSCGVLPAALALRREGASRGPVLSFLVSTPATGADSFLATYGLLGGPFALARLVAAFVTGVVSGVAGNLFLGPDKEGGSPGADCACAACTIAGSRERPSLWERVAQVLNYSFRVLLADAGLWILGGLLIGGAISFFLPAELLQTRLGSPVVSMLVMLAVGVPMYVCSAGSVPIASALMLKGLNPGAALVFLMTGPITNTVSLTVVARRMGKGTAAILLCSVIFCSLGLGLLLDVCWPGLGPAGAAGHVHARIFPAWLEWGASGLLLLLIAADLLRRFRANRRSA